MPLFRDPITDPCLAMMLSVHKVICALYGLAPPDALHQALSPAELCEHYA